MTTWRCPNCQTVQVDGPSCFLCNRSATSCGTCANFRRSLVGGVGYCALDARREPLNGDERRPCWTGQTDPVADGIFGTTAAPSDEGGRSRRGLIDLGSPRGPNRTYPAPPISGR